MEETTTIDKEGKITVPPRIREALGVKEGEKISIRLDGPRLVLEPAPQDIEEKAREWAEKAMNTKTEAFTEEPDESWKWLSREYARRKLGLS